MIIIVSILALVAVIQGYFLRKFHQEKSSLQSKLSVVESVVSELHTQASKDPTQEQMELKEKLDKQWQAILNKQTQDFEARLEEELQKAKDAISFSHIEYKKTITLKRKAYTRKNKANAKPQKIWRSIYDE